MTIYFLFVISQQRCRARDVIAGNRRRPTARSTGGFRGRAQGVAKVRGQQKRGKHEHIEVFTFGTAQALHVIETQQQTAAGRALVVAAGGCMTFGSRHFQLT